MIYIKSDPVDVKHFVITTQACAECKGEGVRMQNRGLRTVPTVCPACGGPGKTQSRTPLKEALASISEQSPGYQEIRDALTALVHDLEGADPCPVCGYLPDNHGYDCSLFRAGWLLDKSDE